MSFWPNQVAHQSLSGPTQVSRFCTFVGPTFTDISCSLGLACLFHDVLHNHTGSRACHYPSSLFSRLGDKNFSMFHFTVHSVTLAQMQENHLFRSVKSNVTGICAVSHQWTFECQCLLHKFYVSFIARRSTTTVQKYFWSLSRIMISKRRHYHRGLTSGLKKTENICSNNQFIKHRPFNFCILYLALFLSTLETNECFSNGSVFAKEIPITPTVNVSSASQLSQIDISENSSVAASGNSANPSHSAMLPKFLPQTYPRPYFWSLSIQINRLAYIWTPIPCTSLVPPATRIAVMSPKNTAGCPKTTSIFSSPSLNQDPI